MVQISYHIAMVIFQLYKERFDNMKSVSKMLDPMEILLPHGVKLVKSDRRYYIKYYSPHFDDWNKFCIGFGLKLSDLADTNQVPEWRKHAGVKTNPDGSASFVGELVGMGQ